MNSVPHQGHRQQTTTPSDMDVLNGRGQGVHRHSGNIKFRKLVFVNRTLYAKCPKQDKMKISRGIVTAIRARGGRFLEFDERTEIYADIGDKRATEKTSQALREGQTNIRKQLYAEGFTKEEQCEMSFDSYFEHSLHFLQSLCNEECNAVAYDAWPLATPSPKPDTVRSGPTAMSGSSMSSATAATMAAVYDQFPGALTVQANAPTAPNPLSRRHHYSIGRFTNEMCDCPSLGRITNESAGSTFSHGSSGPLVGSAGSSAIDQINNRGTTQSFAEEIRHLFCHAEPELIQVEHTHESNDDRVSELRFTDMSSDNFSQGDGGGPSSRLSDSTDYSRFSMMDTSIMTMRFDDLSIYDGECNSGRVAVAV
eukprot:CAMPEP_0183720636 /NCGR_PEP_ID=MMETSP0737-20130205/13190_1 /TAXON_ID=385413 /ORGANISM="Thalassiosira miniscula, Strain CCMP1093" /LENGTH=366 /DNA_ID=CAMNT_0025950529 /DNA_START=119 /DNA_END=1219 /DNA_ORIENTATION=+